MGQSGAVGLQAPPAPGVPRGFQPDEPTRMAKFSDEDGTWGSRSGGRMPSNGGFSSRTPSVSGGPLASGSHDCRPLCEPPGHHGPEGLLSRPRAATSFRTDVGSAFGGDHPSGPAAGSADVCSGSLAGPGQQPGTRLSSMHSFTGSEAGYAPSNPGGRRDPPPCSYDSARGQNVLPPPPDLGLPEFDSMGGRGYGGAGAYGSPDPPAAGTYSSSAPPPLLGGPDPLSGRPYGGLGADDRGPYHYSGGGASPDPLAVSAYSSSAPPQPPPPPGPPEPPPPGRPYGGTEPPLLRSADDYALPRSADDYAGGMANRYLSPADEHPHAGSECGSRLGDFDNGMQNLRGIGRPGSPGGQSVGTMSMLSDMSPAARGALRGSQGAGVPPAQAQEGSVVEVFSATTGRWYPASVSQVQPGDGGEEVLTVQFYVAEDAKQKSMYRSDQQLAPLGTHTGNELPPGFEIRPSQSRPGQLVYLDATTGTRYASAELAWHVHFERMQQRPAAGLETVAAMPAARPPAGGASPPPVAAGPPMSTPGTPAGPKALTLAELQASPEVPESWSGGGGCPVPPHMDPTLGTAGKVRLPCFGDHMGSQAAYLRYEGKAGAADAMAAAAHATTPAMAPLSSAAASAYPQRAATAPRREGPRRPTRPMNPALQTWQEDAFSEWRD